MTNTKIGGHRGMGCTDHDRYQSLRDIAALPVENSTASVVAAFQNGADYVEIDAVPACDGVIFCLHNVVPKDHFFGTEKPMTLLNLLPFSQIAHYKTGRYGTGDVAPFSELLGVIAEHDPRTLPWAVNIEIKGVQGSGQNYETDGFIQNLAETIKASPLAPERILFSSFSLQNILRMSHHFPQAQYGMLFAERGEVKNIYADHQGDAPYQYLQFNAETVDFVLNEWRTQACAGVDLGYMHPEILTISHAMIDRVKQDGLGINCWALFEQLDAPRAEIYKDVAVYCDQQKVPFTVITDYLAGIKNLGI